ncbi:hypothetical protein [Rhizobium sp. C1]|uniref:hypothetical protein n=1 Tax=Rhizobium sp. C1 TaxID=1349799 RepID=UPI001E461C52|nr:hypothetical protein [Rhizobium sp. C1]MCD2177353.1 hypothetical protein [Rhizobium sp. C1]
MSGNIDVFSVDFGRYAESYRAASDRFAISDAAVFILSSYRDMIKNGDEEDTGKNASDYLFDLADRILESGVSMSERESISNQIRYLAQFSIQKSIPSPE